jgi:hypothetical protein
MIALLLRFGRGHWFQPWRSPYLRWRIETYWGLHADDISPSQFRTFVWEHRAELYRFLKWASRMDHAR